MTEHKHIKSPENGQERKGTSLSKLSVKSIAALALSSAVVSGVGHTVYEHYQENKTSAMETAAHHELHELGKSVELEDIANLKVTAIKAGPTVEYDGTPSPSVILSIDAAPGDEYDNKYIRNGGYTTPDGRLQAELQWSGLVVTPTYTEPSGRPMPDGVSHVADEYGRFKGDARDGSLANVVTVAHPNTTHFVVPFNTEYAGTRLVTIVPRLGQPQLTELEQYGDYERKTTPLINHQTEGHPAYMQGEPIASFKAHVEDGHVSVSDVELSPESVDSN